MLQLQGEMGFYEWEGKRRTAQMPRQIFFVNGRAERLGAQMRGLHFYEWEDSEFHCASVVPRFYEWKNRGLFVTRVMSERIT